MRSQTSSSSIRSESVKFGIFDRNYVFVKCNPGLADIEATLKDLMSVLKRDLINVDHKIKEICALLIGSGFDCFPSLYMFALDGTVESIDECESAKMIDCGLVNGAGSKTKNPGEYLRLTQGRTWRRLPWLRQVKPSRKLCKLS